MTGRPAFQPPDQPGIQLPAVSPALQTDAAPATVGERLRAWLVWAGALVGAVALPWWAVSRVQLDGWDAGALLVWAGAGEVVLLLGLGWFSLPLVQDVQRVLYILRLWAAQLTIMQEGARVQREQAQRYGERWYGIAPKEPPPIVVNDQRTRDTLARQEAAIARLEAQLAAVTRPPAPAPVAAARVAVPVPPDDAGETQPLDDARALLAAAYQNGPAQRFIAAAWRNDKLDHDTWTEQGTRYMTSAEWKALTALLGEAGIVTKDGKTRPWYLVPAYRKATEAETHAAVLGALWTAGTTATQLPGDLYRRHEP